MSAARPGVSHDLVAEHRERGVVVHVHASGRVAHGAAVAVAGVLTEADVGDHQQVGGRLLGHLDRLRDNPVVAHRVAANGVLVFGDSEQQNAAQPQVGRLPNLVGQKVGRDLVVARHRADLLAEVLARPHEQRQDQIGRRDVGFTDQAPHGRMGAKPTHTNGGVSRHGK